MTIFNLQIFGEDAEQWLLMPIEDKVEWIRKYTNQQDDAIIEEFVNNPKVSKDKICLTCGLDKHKEEVKEVIIDEVQEMVAIDEKPIAPKFKKSKSK
jgi:hypothetical protein